MFKKLFSKESATDATIAQYTAIGMCIGIVIGALSDNVGIGISLGLCLGAAVGYSIEEEKAAKAKNPDADSQ